MNSGSSGRLSFVRSSFDWSKVQYRFPPGQLTRLPQNPVEALPKIQFSHSEESAVSAQRREARRNEVLVQTRKSWAAYKKFAWKKDALLPLSGGAKDQFSGWSATLVDSLDTLWIMGMRDEFDEAVDAVAQIDFGVSTTNRVSMFETNIRYLGGLLAAYDLSKRRVLLQKAVEIGDLIYSGFNTANRMPVDFLDFQRAKGGAGLTVEGQVVSASPGSFSLELTRLAQITGDDKYYDAISRVTDLFFANQNLTALPGLFPMYVFMSKSDVTTGFVYTLGGGADSLYEYFPKMHALLGGREAKYETLTRGFLDAAKKHLFFRPMVPENDDILISGNVNMIDDKPVLDPETEHLACFAGGTYAMAGRLLRRDEDVVVGARLARGCAYGYRSFASGMMPERLNMVVCDDPCKWDERTWKKERAKRPEWKEHLPKGFTTAKDPRYLLRPEAIESVFYLWRITGDLEWEDTAWDMFSAIVRATPTEFGHAAVKDVTTPEPWKQREDYMESFWIAETLKYFYLIFSPPDLISLDKYVFNTEAHPFLRPQ
ncbi:seven-hairpin glycosidase [Thozetella sp. PMI_491]|nr:seven-hairpin glycosidase [Thozetella sp. PMI_491]